MVEISFPIVSFLINFPELGNTPRTAMPPVEKLGIIINTRRK